MVAKDVLVARLRSVSHPFAIYISPGKCYYQWAFHTVLLLLVGCRPVDPSLFRDSPAGRAVRTGPGYWAFIPNPLPPPLEWTQGLVTALSRADRALGELAGIGRTMGNPHLLIVPFMRKEAVLSSAIEGTQASISDLYAFEAEQLSFLDRPADVKEVHNYVRAMEQGLERLNSLPVSLRLFREIHGNLMQGVRGDQETPGEFRRSQNWIGPPGCTLEDATYVPPPSSEVGPALAALEHYLHAEEDAPPLVRLALMHYQFEAIHPFSDGNGRTGRILNLLYLVEQQLLELPVLYLSRAIIRDKAEYYRQLHEVTTSGTWEPWILYLVNAVNETARWTTAKILAMRNLLLETTQHVQRKAPSLYSRELVKLVFVQPYCRIANVVGAGLAKRPTASEYLKELSDIGVLNEVKVGREKLFIHPKLMALPNGDFPQRQRSTSASRTSAAVLEPRLKRSNRAQV